MTQTTAIAVLCIAVAGVGAQWIAWRLRLPAIVLLFAAGLLFGPGLEILQPSVAFGPALRPIIGLCVAIVVFEGGLALDVRELRAAGEGVFRLTMVALPISFVLATLAAHVTTGMLWGTSALFGAITVVTGPTVVLPLLRNTRLERRASSFLKWEAIVNDPIGALLAAIVLSLMVVDNRQHGSLATHLAAGLLVSAFLGVGAAVLVRWLIKQDQMPETLKTPMLLALALGVYVLSNLVMDEAGLAAATIFGIALANLRVPGIGELARFKEALVVLIVSALFIVLTASLDRSLFTQISWKILFLTAAMIFVVRPLAITLATLGSQLTWQERVLAGWIAPRGIVAAAVAGVASGKLAGAGYPNAHLVMPSIFALIAATMILHGFSLAPLARRLGLTLGDRPGLAILGATSWSIDLAQTLMAAGTPVLLVDAYPGALTAARDKRIPILQADVLSSHGTEELAGRRIDYLFAATANDVYNSLVCSKLGPGLGRARVFQLAPPAEDPEAWLGLDREWRGQQCGRPAVDVGTVRRRHKKGWRFTIVPYEEKTEEVDDKAEAAPSDPESENVTFLVVRRNGDLVFASVESAELTLSAGDRAVVFAEERQPQAQPERIAESVT